MIENQEGHFERKEKQSGSPQSGEPLSIAVGKIRRPHGVKGEVIFEPYPEYGVKLKKGNVVFIGKKKEAFSICSVRQMDQNDLIAFDGMNDCDVVGFMRNQLLYVRAEDLGQHPAEGNYPHQVLGMQVVDEKGEILGQIEEVILTGANQVYVVKREKEREELLLPVIDSVILNVDLEKKMITVKPQIWD